MLVSQKLTSLGSCLNKMETNIIKQFIYTTSMMIIGAITVVIFLFVFINFTNEQPNVINITIKDCQIGDYNIKDQITIIALNVSNSKEYVINKYDCTDFSKELVKQLKEQLNLSAYCIFGQSLGYNKQYNLFDPLHTWVGIDLNNETIYVEATGGYIVPKELMTTDYKVIKKGLCI